MLEAASRAQQRTERSMQPGYEGDGPRQGLDTKTQITTSAPENW